MLLSPLQAVGQPWTTFFMLGATLVKFGLHAGNMKFNVRNEEWTSISAIICTVVPVYLITRYVRTKHTDNNRMNLLKIALTA
jgi:hypothetical protein